MSNRLLPADVISRLAALRRRSALTALQLGRLETIAAELDGDGRFLLRTVLVAGEFPAGDAQGQDAFQDFRKKVNRAAAEAGVELMLELESRKSPPDLRHGWFTEGDLVDAGIGAFTEATARRTAVTHPVDQAVRDFSNRIYVSHVAPARRVEPLLRQLREAVALEPGTWDVVDVGSVGLGEDAETARDRLCGQADVRVALISPGYLTDRTGERDRALNAAGPVVPFALSGLPDGELKPGRLRRHDIRRRAKPWDELIGAEQRRHFVSELLDEIKRQLRSPEFETPPPPDEQLVQLAEQATRRWATAGECLVDADLSETTLQESRLDRPDPAAGHAVPAVRRLVDWATSTGSGAQRLCALLGDVGMGKTTTTKLFTQRLLDLRAQGARVPLPILFDLRDVRITGLVENLTLDHVLATMLAANRPADVPPDRLTADVLRRRIAQGDTVVVFDGLDEVLVHLSPHDQQLFTRQLWRAVDERSGSKMLLTCRTQYFRTIRDEIGFFTGEGRDGLRGHNYLALLMLPFRDEQVRTYLLANLGRDENAVDRFLGTLAEVHNLPDLARRPVTLRLIADQVEFIEWAKAQGRPLRSVDLYREFVDRWLSRDQAKHSLEPEHKQLLMEEIAAGQWRSGKNSWESTEVDNWLLDILERRPDLRRHYERWTPDLWKADFRTATFLARNGDTFSFGHRSLAEYFLSRYLCRALIEGGRTPTAWAMAVPSPETLDFLGQLIAGLPDEQRSAALAGLRVIAGRYLPDASELAFAYALRAAERGHPHQSLHGIQLPEARLAGWTIGSDAGPKAGEPRSAADLLGLAGANFVGADLRRTRIHRVDLTGADLGGADLTMAELHDSRLGSVRLTGARAAGTVLRRCDITGTTLTDARLHRTELLHCTPAPGPAPGLLIAPLAGHQVPGRAALRPAVGPRDTILAAAYSADGAHILTAGRHIFQIWDAATGQPLQSIGHTGWITAVAYAPDGIRIVTAGVARGARIWDATTGQPLHELTTEKTIVQAVAFAPDGHCILTAGYGKAGTWDAATGRPGVQLVGPTNGILAAVYSPDGTHILTASDDKTTRIWDATTGQPLHQLTGHTDKVRTVTYSPDGTHLLTAGDDKTARIWDATTGQPLYQLTGHTDKVRTATYSPDGTHILTASDDKTARIWDATTGQPLHQLTGRHIGTRAVVYAPDGRHFLTVSAGQAQVWDAATREPRHQLTGQAISIEIAIFSPDGSRMLVVSAHRAIRIWNVATGELLHEIATKNSRVQAVAYAPDARFVFTAGYGKAQIWDAATGQPGIQLVGSTNGIRAVAYSPDGTQILTGGDKTTRIWDAATGDLLHQLTGTGAPRTVAYSPDGSCILIGSVEETQVCDAATGRPLHRLSGHFGIYAPDGRHILTASGGAAQIWDAATGQARHRLTGDFSQVTGIRAIAYSPDGNHIATAGSARTVQIWDAATGQPRHRLVGRAGEISTVSYSPDGTRILTGGTDGTARQWDAATGHPIGFWITVLPDGQVAQFDAATQVLVGASDRAWRWLGWDVIEDGRHNRLPAESYGALPPLRGPAAASSSR